MNEWDTCEHCKKRFHLSEYSCDCDSETKRPEHKKMWNAGYDYEADGRWSKRILNKKRTCRKDHKDGTIIKGDTYWETVFRTIDFEDDSERGLSMIQKYKRKIFNYIF